MYTFREKYVPVFEMLSKATITLYIISDNIRALKTLIWNLHIDPVS